MARSLVRTALALFDLALIFPVGLAQGPRQAVITISSPVDDANTQARDRINAVADFGGILGSARCVVPRTQKGDNRASDRGPPACGRGIRYF